MAFVPIIMGSRSDIAHAQKVVAALTELGVESELRVASAHKSAAHVLEMLQTYENDGRDKVYVTIAGRSNALGGMVDSNVAAPVITCPVYSDRFGGADIFSSVRMPSGVAPALVLDPKGAALLAAKIFGMRDAGVKANVTRLQQGYTQRLIQDDDEVRRS